MKIYISIPISGYPIEQQKAKAKEIADRLRSLGHEPVNPFDTPEAPSEMPEKEKYAYYMGEDVKRLLTCDAVYLCKGWNLSNGCMTEYEVAKIYGKELFFLRRNLCERRRTVKIGTGKKSGFTLNEVLMVYAFINGDDEALLELQEFRQWKRDREKQKVEYNL